MNALAYTIANISTEDNLSLLSLETPIGALWVLLLATQDMGEDMRVGARGSAYFKPTQILLMPQNPAPCTHNCFASRIARIQREAILSLVSLEGGISALVPTRSIEGFSEGDCCFWWVNPSDILLQS